MQKKGRILLWARELRKIWGLPFNIYTMAETIEFKFVTQHGFAKPTINHT